QREVPVLPARPSRSWVLRGMALACVALLGISLWIARGLHPVAVAVVNRQDGSQASPPIVNPDDRKSAPDWRIDHGPHSDRFAGGPRRLPRGRSTYSHTSPSHSPLALADDAFLNPGRSGVAISYDGAKPFALASLPPMKDDFAVPEAMLFAYFADA